MDLGRRERRGEPAGLHRSRLPGLNEPGLVRERDELGAVSRLQLVERPAHGPKVRWVALAQLVRDIGPIFGLVSFGVFLSLLVLYIVRAREIRKLRREAPFLAESNGNPEP